MYEQQTWEKHVWQKLLIQFILFVAIHNKYCQWESLNHNKKHLLSFVWGELADLLEEYTSSHIRFYF